MVESLPPLEALAKVRAGALLLDVREDDEFSAGRSADARHIRLSDLPDRFEELSSDQVIVCVCRSGGRSLRAAEFLTEQGYVAINLAGGMTAWFDAGLPMVCDDGDPTVA